MAAETKSIWLELSEAISQVSIFIVSGIVALSGWMLNKFEILSKRVTRLENRQTVDEERHEAIQRTLTRIEHKLDIYDKNINEFWKNNPGLK